MERDVQEFGGSFAVFEALGDDAEGERLHSRDGFIAISAVTHHASQRGYFRKPPAVVLALDLNRKDHGGYCTIRGLSNKAATTKRVR